MDKKNNSDEKQKHEKENEAKKNIMKGFHEALKAQDNEPPKPNELDSTCGVADDDLVKRFREAVDQENKNSKEQGLPVTGYDYEKKASYIEYPDGRRVYGDKT